MKLIFKVKIMNKNYLQAVKITRKMVQHAISITDELQKYDITDAVEFSPIKIKKLLEHF